MTYRIYDPHWTVMVSLEKVRDSLYTTLLDFLTRTIVAYLTAVFLFGKVSLAIRYCKEVTRKYVTHM